MALLSPQRRASRRSGGELVHPPCTESGLPEPSPLTTEHLARMARGLAHPARIAILEQFGDRRPRITGDIVAETGLAQSTVSEHLRFLRDAELLSARKDGPRVWYCLRRGVIEDFARAVEGLAGEACESRDLGP